MDNIKFDTSVSPEYEMEEAMDTNSDESENSPTKIRVKVEEFNEEEQELSSPIVNIDTAAELDDSDLEHKNRTPSFEPKASCSQQVDTVSELTTNIKDEIQEQEDQKQIDRRIADLENRQRQRRRQCSSLTYRQMIFMAITNSPNGELFLEDVYGFIQHNFPLFDSLKSNWQRNIRAALSKKEYFITEERFISFEDGTSKILNLYTIVPDAFDYLKHSVEKVISQKGFESLQLRNYDILKNLQLQSNSPDKSSNLVKNEVIDEYDDDFVLDLGNNSGLMMDSIDKLLLEFTDDFPSALGLPIITNVDFPPGFADDFVNTSELFLGSRKQRLSRTDDELAGTSGLIRESLEQERTARFKNDRRIFVKSKVSQTEDVFGNIPELFDSNNNESFSGWSQMEHDVLSPTSVKEEVFDFDDFSR